MPSVPVVLFDLPAKEGPKNGIVLQRDREPEEAEPGAARRQAIDAALHRSRPTTKTTSSCCKDCDLVIEAIAERMDWKHDLYAKVAPHIAPNAIFASNTSGLSITTLSEGFDADLQGALLRRAFLQSAALHAPGRADPDRGDPIRRSSTSWRPS